MVELIGITVEELGKAALNADCYPHEMGNLNYTLQVGNAAQVALITVINARSFSFESDKEHRLIREDWWLELCAKLGVKCDV